MFSELAKLASKKPQEKVRDTKRRREEPEQKKEEQEPAAPDLEEKDDETIDEKAVLSEDPTVPALFHAERLMSQENGSAIIESSMTSVMAEVQRDMGDTANEGSSKYVAAWIVHLTNAWWEEISSLTDPHSERKEFYLHCKKVLPLYKALLREDVESKMLASLTVMCKNLSENKFSEAEAEYFSMTMGSQNWRLGIYTGSIHMRKVLEKIQRGSVKHPMNDTETRESLLQMKILLTKAQNRFSKHQTDSKELK